MARCKNRRYESYGSYDYCMDYEMDQCDVSTCPRFVPEEDEEPYCPSSTAGDYGPGNPWDAPGMSIRDFI